MIRLITHTHPAGIAFVLAVIFVLGCNKETTLIQPASTTHKIDIQVAEYSRNYYFVDTLYRQFWEPLHASPSPVITDTMWENAILKIDVWKTVEQLNPQTNGIELDEKAYVNLPPHRLGEVYQPGFVTNLDTTSIGNYQHSYWIRLDPNKDYVYNQFGGYIVFTNSVDDQQAYAVSYTIMGPPIDPNSPFGGGNNMVYGDTVAGGTAYLKLIKPMYVSDHPEYRPAWDLMLKNVYTVGRLGMYDKLDVRIARRYANSWTYQLYGHALLEILGLDRYDNTFASKPDGVFDFIPGVTIDVNRGDIIFPTLRPFDTGISEFFSRSNIPVPDSLRYPLAYDTTSYVARADSVQNKYVIHAEISVQQ